jgi:hypothetical protein
VSYPDDCRKFPEFLYIRRNSLFKELVISLSLLHLPGLEHSDLRGHMYLMGSARNTADRFVPDETNSRYQNLFNNPPILLFNTKL